MLTDLVGGQLDFACTLTTSRGRMYRPDAYARSP